MKNLKFLTSTLVAHRGYYNNKTGIPENSILAFKMAVKYGYIIELDVHLLKDNNIVVFHDDNLKRVCGVNKNINDCTYDDIKKLTLFNTKQRIPLLKDVLNEVKGKVPLLIETKYYPKYGVLEANLMKLLNNYNGLYAIQSFYPKSIYWFKKNYNNIPRGILSTSIKKENTFKNIIFIMSLINIIIRPDFISYNVEFMPNKYTDDVKKSKLLIGWIIKNKNDYDKYKNYCDNLICENMRDYKRQ